MVKTMNELILEYASACAATATASNARAAIIPFNRTEELRKELLARSSDAMAQRLQRVAQLTEGLMPLIERYASAWTDGDVTHDRNTLAEHIDAIRQAAAPR